MYENIAKLQTTLGYFLSGPIHYPAGRGQKVLTASHSKVIFSGII